MKRLILPAVFAVVLTGSMIFAQQPAPDVQQPPAPIQRHHAPNPQREAARLTRQLNLTPDQTAKIEPIFADREQKVATFMSDSTLSDDARKQQLHAIRKSSMEQLDAVLTPDQREQMKAMRHNHDHPSQPQSTTPPPTA